MSLCKENVEGIISLIKEHSVHKAFAVFLRAYAVGYALTTTPQLIGYWSLHIIKFLNKAQVVGDKNTRDIVGVINLIYTLVRESIKRVIWRRLHMRGVGMMCGLAMGGARLMEEIVINRKKKTRRKKIADAKMDQKANALATPERKSKWTERDSIATTFFASTISSSLSLYYIHRVSPSTIHSTIDFTMFALVRAFDVLVRFAYHERMSERIKKRWIPKWLTRHTDTAVFIASCTEIMSSWFFEPQRLPKAYVHWITRMAAMDSRLLDVVRLMRQGKYEYGRDSGYAHILGSYCAEIGLDPSLGNPANGQLPCLVVHGNTTKSCELHTMIRWITGFLMALKIYIPVHLLPPLLFRPRRFFKSPLPILLHVIIATMRSASFLATFIASIWYSCCVMRNRIGPTLFPSLNPTIYDRLLGPWLGSMICGISLLFESKRRRGEMALYVAPRALYCFWNRIVANNAWWQQAESLRELGEVGVFGFSMGVVITSMKYRKHLVRPLVRGVLEWILKA
ncbi:8685_t:CDS:2 [Paraglomus occultum]|uniref:8685_t:CDS:1 n=1 Tax=Paraglomus occultum TaxID=144539 RepID=A0A9N8ZTW4_9GLOM|nr:8685_t:CDS:2 [Paraglomus occultum]